MATNGKTVLLVEDNEDNRIVYSTILRHFGYEVSEALNGEEGIAKARAERPDHNAPLREVVGDRNARVRQRRKSQLVEYERRAYTADGPSHSGVG